MTEEQREAYEGEIEALEGFCVGLRHLLDRGHHVGIASMARSMVARCHNLIEMGAVNHALPGRLDADSERALAFTLGWEARGDVDPDSDLNEAYEAVKHDVLSKLREA